MRKAQKQKLFILIVILGIIAFVLCSLLLKPSSTAEKVIECKQTDIPVGEIVPGTTISQTFLDPGYPIRSISLCLATYARQNSGTIEISIKSSMDEEVIQSWSVDVSTIQDNQFADFVIDHPIASKIGQEYLIDITSLDGTHGNAVTIWSSQGDVYPDGELYINGSPRGSDLAFTVNTLVASHSKEVYQVIGLIALSLLILLGMYFLLGYQGKRFSFFAQTYAFGALLAIVTIFLYLPYLSGDALYVFGDIASDSFEQTIPSFLNTAHKLEKYGRIPAWDFSVFLGTAQSPGQNWLNLWPSLFGSDHVISLLGIAQVVKVILAGLLFFAFLKEAGFSYLTRFIVSFAYAFCGHMTIRGTWNSYPGEVVFVAFALLVLEWFYKGEKRGLLVPVAVLFLSVVNGVYSVALYLGIFVVYMLFRYCTENVIRKWELMRLLAKFLLLYGVGVCISAFVIIPSLRQITGSARVASSVTSVGLFDLLKLSDLQTITTAYLRTLANDLQGGPQNFAGEWNYLEAGTFYCGLLPLLLVPHCFYKAKKKQFIWYTAALLILFAYCLFENIRLLANGYSNTTFKLSSFFGILILLFLSAKALDGILLKRRVSYPLLLVSGALLILSAVVLLQISKAYVDEKLLLLVDCFLFGYIALLISLQIHKKAWKKTITCLLIVLFVMEISINAYSSIRDRGTVSIKEMQSIYQSGIGEMASELQKSDTDLFRVDYPSVHLCQPLAQDFMGTRGYVGGSSFSKEVNNFLSAVGSNNTEEIGYTRYIYGMTGINEVNTLLGTKYLMYTQKDWPNIYVPYGYHEIAQIKYPDIRIFENEFSLPLFFTYDRVISEQDFYTLSKLDRRRALLDVLVLEDVQSATATAISWQADHPLVGRQELLVNAQKTSGTFLYEILQKSDSPYLLVNFQLQAEPMEYLALKELISWGKTKNDLSTPENQMLYVTRIGTEDVSLIIPNNNISWLKIARKGENAQISNFHIYAIRNTYFDEYKQAIENRRKEDISIMEFAQDRIKLFANLSSEQYLFASIPYDKGWQAKVDGQSIALEKANVGFMALKLTAGEHAIELAYTPSLSVMTWGPFGLGIAGWLIMIAAYRLKNKYCKN